MVLSLNLHLSVFYIPSRENPADHPSRRFSPADSKLARHLWLRLQSHPCFGGSLGHSVDLMALDSNAQSDGGGVILPHFTPYPTPLSSGVDFFGQDFSQSVSKPLFRNPYIFPPILLIGPDTCVLRSYLALLWFLMFILGAIGGLSFPSQLVFRSNSLVRVS